MVDTGVYGQTGPRTPAGFSKSVLIDTSGNLYLVGTLSQANGLLLVGTGTPIEVAKMSGTASTATVTLTYTPPAVAGTYYVEGYYHVTTAGTSTIPTLAFTDEGGSAVSATALTVLALGGTTNLASMTATGRYSGRFAFAVDNSAGAISVVVTPTGSTFNYDVRLYQVA